MSQHTGSLIFYFYSHKYSLNLLDEKFLNESHWPMRRIRLLECNNNNNRSNIYSIVANKIIFNIPGKKTVLFNFLQNLLGRFTWNSLLI